MYKGIEVEIRAQAQRVETDAGNSTGGVAAEVGGSTGDLAAVQRLIAEAAKALQEMGKWEAARAVAQTLPSGSGAQAALSQDGGTPLFTFGIPQGPRGERGEQGLPGAAGGINLYALQIEVGTDGWTMDADELYEKTVDVEGIQAGDAVRVSAQEVPILMAAMPDTAHLTLTTLEAPEEAFTLELVISRNGGGMTSMDVETAQRLTTPRMIALSGDAQGQAEFDGSADAVIHTAVEEINNEELEEMLR